MTRLPSYKTLAKALASIAPTIDDTEVRDAFAYVADFLHQRTCAVSSDEECVHIAVAYANGESTVSKALQKKISGSSKVRV